MNQDISFLDVLITKNGDGSLAHQVYRKHYHTKKYLNANSHHHLAKKCGVLITLVTRPLKVCDVDYLEDEKKHLLKVFENNGHT